MTTYGQSTIHSKLAKFQNTNENFNAGRLLRGSNTQFGNKSNKRQLHSESEIIKEVEMLPKSKLNVSRKMKNERVIPGQSKNEEIVLMESSTFPAIYFKKTTLRNVLKQFSLPQNCKQLLTEDPRTILLYQIISNLLNEVNFYIFNIIVCQNMQNNSYYIFFSDCETLPFTKCCNAPVFIQLQENGSGKILCNSISCSKPNLAEFLINFDDGHKLWPNIPYFAQASVKDKQLKQKISRLIMNGKYKKKSLVGIVQNTSKEIVNLFYNSKESYKQAVIEKGEDVHDDDMFVTGAASTLREHTAKSDKHFSINNAQDKYNEQAEVHGLLIENDPNLQSLKIKLKYITKKQIDIGKRLSRSIAEESKVFHHDFDIIRRIDEQMLKNKNIKASSKITFPQLMSQIRRQQKTKKHQNTQINQ